MCVGDTNLRTAIYSNIHVYSLCNETKVIRNSDPDPEMYPDIWTY